MAKSIGNGGVLYMGPEAVAVPDEPEEWWCQGMVHKKGKTVVVAIAKTGKTVFATMLADRLATGKDMLSFPCQQCVVLYIVLERYHDFKKKLKSIGAGHDIAKLYVLDYSKKPLIMDTLDLKGYNTIDEAITEVKPNVVILDAKYRTTSKEEKDEVATKIWIDRIDSYIERYGCAFVIIHHSPKNTYSELVNRSAGSSLIARWADIIIGMRRTSARRSDPHRVIEFVSNYGYEPDAIDIRIVDNGLEDEIPKDKVGEAYTLLKAELDKGNQTSPTKVIKELADQSGIGERTFWTAWGLIKRGTAS